MDFVWYQWVWNITRQSRLQIIYNKQTIVVRGHKKPFIITYSILSAL